MSTIYNRFRTAILTISAFGRGITLEKNFHLYADVVADSKLNDSLVLSNSGDVILDAKQSSTPPSSPEVLLITKHGFPSLDSLRSYPNFVVSYDRRNRIPHWVLERITAEKLSAEQYDRKDWTFSTTPLSSLLPCHQQGLPRVRL